MFIFIRARGNEEQQTVIDFRFSIRLMVTGSIAMHTITFVAIRIQKFQATPQILHDRDPEVNPRHSRHNKAIVSRHSVWQFLLLYFLVVVLLLLLGSAKGTTYRLKMKRKTYVSMLY